MSRPTPPVPADWLFLDLEGRTGVRAIGAWRDGRALHLDGVSRDALAELERFAEGATLLVCHNGWGFDRKRLAGLRGAEQVVALPMLDTLPLSALCFPKRPYHPLVKDYKLVRSELGNPARDAELTAQLLGDVLERLREPTPAQRFGLAALASGSSGQDGDEGRGDPRAGTALGELLRARFGIRVQSLEEAGRAMLRGFDGSTCRAELPKIVESCVRGEVDALDLALALAWVEVADTGSVLPRWAAKRGLEPDGRGRVGAGPVALIRALRETCCDNDECGWCRTTNDPDAQLKRWFGFDAFRAVPAAPDGGSLQRAIVRNGMVGKPTFAVLPTGGGKSICFQIPALTRAQRTGAMTVVVSPLQSLMKDQVDNLRDNVDVAGEVHGMLTLPERARQLEDVRSGKTAILYLSPEQLRNKSVRAALASREIAAWVFDEAHCLSKWGHDFRTDYLYAPRFIRELAQEQRVETPPVHCFTATAQKQVVDEVCDLLGQELGQHPERLLGGVERTNLSFEVVGVASLADKRAELVRRIEDRGDEAGSVVVFAATRRQTEETAAMLSESGFAASAYHAGLEPNERRRLQDEFIRAERAIIVATSAFGMGVDKPDVRLVVHLSMPGSLEAYLQEAGRAGRDGLPAHCVLLFDPEDAETQFGLARRSRLNLQDMRAILRAVRKAKSAKDSDDPDLRTTVVTRAELMRIGSARARFDADDPAEHTRVNTALAWLERAELLRRDENVNRVFQGSLKAKTLAEARARLDTLALSAERRRNFERIIEVLASAEPDEMLSADDVATAANLWSEDDPVGAGDHVLGILRELAEVGLLGEHVRFTAFLRSSADPTPLAFERLVRTDRALLSLMRVQAPDLEPNQAVPADIELLGVALAAAADGEPLGTEQLRVLLKSYEHDGDGLGGGKSLDVRFRGRGVYEVTLRRDSWDAVELARSRFTSAVAVVLRRILADGSEQRDTGPLVAFSEEELEAALRGDLEVRTHLSRPRDLIQAALLLLHDTRVITLQNGLAVFRQAMTLSHRASRRRREFKESDYDKLRKHYTQRNTQIHVMAEYGRLGVADMDSARRLALDWFELDGADFLNRHMPGRQEEIERGTTAESYARIVTRLGNAEQEEIVRSRVGRNQLVLAGPGAGKTRVIVHRIAWLVRLESMDPAGILALAYNRSAANEIRKRLRELIGDDGRFVRVHTVHGLAARLCQRAVAPAAPGEDLEEGFRRLVEHATAMLEADGDDGERAAREGLVGGCTHLLVDEYQDIDEPQARFLRALAGRLRDEALDPATGKWREDARPLAVLAVGDDDQNIYGFRDTSVRFIREFADEFRAERRTLVENHRSTRNIVEVANHLIEAAPDRLKANEPIRPSAARAAEPAGGRDEALDPVTRGRVRVVTCEDRLGVGDFVAHEIGRLRALHPELGPGAFAVLGRRRSALAPVREALRTRRIPCRWSVGRKQSIDATRVREVAEALAWLDARGAEAVRPDGVLDALPWLRTAGDPWCELVTEEIEAWELGNGPAPAPAAALSRALREAVAEQRRTHMLGRGVTVTTIHQAKGLEFPYVFVVPDDRHPCSDEESDRRLLYVGLTRARSGATVVVPRGVDEPLIERIAGAACVDRVPWRSLAPPDAVEHQLLTLADFWIDWAGRDDDPALHRRLAGLRFGTEVTLRAQGDWVQVRTLGRDSGPVAAVKREVADALRARLDRLAYAEVVAMVGWGSEDSGPEHRHRLRRPHWYVPAIELRWRA